MKKSRYHVSVAPGTPHAEFAYGDFAQQEARFYRVRLADFVCRIF